MRAFVISHSITNRDERSLDKYLNDISRYDVLTPDEEVELFHAYASGDENAMSRIVRHNLRFVVSVAKKYQNMGLGLPDLINEGNLGLIKAAKRFDVSKGFKFISYAVWWIRQSILQALNDKSRKIRVPLNVTGNMARVQKKSLEFIQREERDPTIEELAEMTELSRDAVERCIKNYKKCRSLDAPVQEDSRTSLSSMLSDNNIRRPDHSTAVRETQQIEVQQMLRNLPEREAMVLSMYFGINRQHSSSLSDISDRIGLSRERVRQIRDRAINKLRSKANRHQVTATFSPN